MQSFANKWINLRMMSIFVFLAVVSSGCGKEDPKNVTLASIGKERISLADFYERISTLPVQYQDIIKKRKNEYLQEIIGDTLLYQEALRRGVHKSRNIKRVIKEATKKIIVARFLKDEIDDVIEVDEADIRNHYNKHQSEYATTEFLRVSHILVNTKEDAEAVLIEIKNGVEFETLAKERSIDPTAHKGGDIGYFPKGQLMSEIERACDKLGPGEVSGVVKTKLGYHVIKLTERRLPELKPIEEVEGTIKQQVRTVKRREIFNDLLESLRERTIININEDALSEVVPTSSE
ncbi:MAG: peptidyl-prolyl cis-trans isomerase [Candidatus Omnitrophica bacterium]|nr:peptidyl-prolyl cis-trans isomerase [Candidatus Omnitrophota bacterium]